MIYVDTSCLLPLFLREPSSERLLDWLELSPDTPRAISDWTRTEFVGAVGMKVRDQSADAAEAHRALDRFDKSVPVHWTVWPVQAAEFAEAGNLLARFDLGLRAGDALHLSIALNRGVQQLASLDKGMIRAARTLGLDAFDPQQR